MDNQNLKRKVLVVDDQPENLAVLTGLLKGEYRVMAATNGATALEIATSDKRPDLILLDVMMPEMDGHEVCRRLKENRETSEIPVIFTTAMSEVDDEAKGLELGAVDYIIKPLNPTIVEARVRTHLALKEKNEIIKREREELRIARDQLTAAMKKVQQDIDRAREIQETLLPGPDDQPFPEALTIVSRYIPEMAVGGDFFDFKALDTKHVGIVLADVCGHGMQAAFITGLIKTSFELAGDARRWPEYFVDKLNRTLCQLTPEGSFATMVYCIYNVETRKLRTLNAGHQPFPILITPGGQAAPAGKPSAMPLGLFEYDDIASEPLIIEAGTKLLLATDGLTEAVNTEEEFFGFDRLMSVVNENGSSSISDLEGAVLEAVSDFTRGAKPSDDIAVLAIEFH